jgi:serine O-acetyltransferase
VGEEKKLKSEYSEEQLTVLLGRQLNFFLISEEELQIIAKAIKETLIRVTFCFSHSKNKYYRKNGEVYFNPFHAAHYTIFLYYLSHTLFQKSQENRIICDKIYYLNRMLNACDLFYEVNLPDIFFLDHPLGSVIGRGQFGNYFSFSQGCTVGNNKGVFPVIGEKVKMLSNSKVLGNCKIGNNVIIAANTYIKDSDIPNDSIVFGSSPNLVIKKKK